MPPNLPANPTAIQLWTLLAVILSPFILAFITWLLKDRKTISVDENDRLVKNQATIIGKITDTIDRVPALMAALEKQMDANDALRKRIMELEDQVHSLGMRMAEVERDRDAWRDQAQGVPMLKGQIQAYESMLAEKLAEIERLSADKQRLEDRIAFLETEGGTAE